MKKISLALLMTAALVSPTMAHAATPTAKPTVKKAAGKEGTAKHEMTEATTGTGEEGSKTVAKAKTSVITKKATAKKATAKKK